MKIPEKKRNSVVHGWAFREHTPEQEQKIKEFLVTGEISVLPERYQKVAKRISEALRG